MPKIMDSNQPHQLRASNLCSLSVVSNNNIKEINHNQQHRTVGIGGTILTTTNSNSSNNTTSNINNNSSSTVYSVPLVSMCTAAPESEVDVTWTADQYRQQQDQMITESASNRSKGGVSLDSNSNQNQIISKQHVNPNGQSKHTESSVPNGSNAVMSSTESVNTDTVCLRANENENIMPDITRPAPPTSVVTQVDLSSLSNSGCGAGTDVKPKHLTVNANQPHNVTEYISIKGAQSTETAVVNNHLSVLLSASSCPKIKVSVNLIGEKNELILICDDPQKINTLETNESDMVTTTTAVSAGLKLEIQDFAHGSAQVVGASILVKKENDLNETDADVSFYTCQFTANKKYILLFTYYYKQILDHGSSNHKETTIVCICYISNYLFIIMS